MSLSLSLSVTVPCVCVTVCVCLSLSLCDYALCLATGNGETIMKYCPSFKIVDLMNQGFSPQEACETVIKHITSKEKDELEMGVIALDIKVCIPPNIT